MYFRRAESEESDNRRKALVDGLSVLNERERRFFEARRLADEPITLEDLAPLAERLAAAKCHARRRRIQYALETDWLVGAAGFEPLHIRIGICQDSQPGGRESNLRISN